MRTKLVPLIILALILSILGLGTFLERKTVDATSEQAAPANSATLGKWSSVFDLPVKATHTNLLANGKIMTWPSFSEGDNPYIFDPLANTSLAASKSGLNIFCSGHISMPDGKIFVAGGHTTPVGTSSASQSLRPVGIPAATIYDPTTNTWTRLPDMNNSRWYPTTHVLPSGDILVVSGSIANGEINKIPQVWDIRTNSWRTLTGAELTTSLYPFIFPAPNGQVFMAGVSQQTRYLDTTGNGSWGSPINTNFGRRINGTGVEYAKGQILITAGTLNPNELPTKTAETIDLNNETPKWKYTSPMNVARRHANSTLLPNGQVLVTGGTQGIGDNENFPALMAEMWNPTNGKWTKLASNSTYRGYHSTALLLPDGRVFVGGGEKSGNSAQYYSPPYLFQGEKPVITLAPQKVDYGQKFTVKTPNASLIKFARWIRIGSVTHSFNESQIINRLPFVKTGTNSLELTTPSDGNTTPPGYYMLFILNDKDVPSVAKIIKVGNINVSLEGINSPATIFPQSKTTDPMEKMNHMDMAM